MKKCLLVVAVVFATSASAAQFRTLLDPFSGQVATFRTGTGTELVVALPAETRFTQFGAQFVSPHVTQFFVRVAPSGGICVPIGLEGGAVVGTGVRSPQSHLEPTAYSHQEASPSFRGWTNYYFNVNGGTGATVTGIGVVFRRGGQFARQCDFHVGYTSDAPEGSIQPLHGRAAGTRAAAAPLALQAEAQSAKALPEVEHPEVKLEAKQ